MDLGHGSSDSVIIALAATLPVGRVPMKISRETLVLFLILAGVPASAADWPAPVPPLIPGAFAYVPIPSAAVAPDALRVYKVIYDTTRAASKPEQPVDGILLAATNLSALRGQGVAGANTRFALIFHGRAIDGILDNAHYKAKFGVDNPNLAMLAGLKKAGAEIFVCGQMLIATKTDPATLSPDVTIASEAFIVLMTYQNDGYALLQF
jgi:intracellular sulfur oxidation DsrE/DsrF family protein